jgi:hypothetical protein
MKIDFTITLTLEEWDKIQESHKRDLHLDVEYYEKRLQEKPGDEYYQRELERAKEYLELEGPFAPDYIMPGWDACDGRQDEDMRRAGIKAPRRGDYNYRIVLESGEDITKHFKDSGY